MKLVFLNYDGDQRYDDPVSWLTRLAPTAGILRSLGEMHTVVGIEHINFEGRFQDEEVSYHFTRLKRKGARFPFRLHRMISGLRPDVVFVHGFIFPSEIIQLRMQLPRNSKIIVINHAERPPSGLKRILQWLADKGVSAYLFTSKEMADEWVKRSIISCSDKVHEVMEASSVFSELDKRTALQKTRSPRDKTFLWVGRLDQNKDPFTVLRAFARFLKVEPKAQLYMIYHTDELEADIRLFFQNHPLLENAVQLVGKTPHADLQYWYNSADFFISASHYEGSGIAACEAMSCGCIPILTDIPSFRKMTGPGVCGFLYEKGNDEALFEILCRTTNMDIPGEKQKTIDQFNAELSFSAIANKINGVLGQLKSVD